MKKLLLSFLAVIAFFGVAKATDPTVIQFTTGSTAYEKTQSYTNTWASTDGFWSFTAFNNNNNGWNMIKAGSKNAETTPTIQTQKLSPAPISNVVINVCQINQSLISNAKLLVADNADFTNAKETALTAPSATGDWIINVNSTAIGEYFKITMSAGKPSSNGNAIQITKITINYDDSAADPNAAKPAGLAWSAANVDVDADLIEEFEAPTLSNPNNLNVTYASSNTTVATVNASTGVVALTGEEGTAEISAAFAGNDSFKAQTVSYTINVKSLAAPTSVKATIALADKTEFKVAYELTVGFVNSRNVFACDAAGDFIQIYATNSYKVGDKIPAGWEGTYELYNGVTPEITNATLPAATAGTFTPKAVAVSDINNSLVNSVVTINNVVFAEATPSTKDNFTGKVGETELSFRNNYTKPSVEAGTYDVTVVVTLYKASDATEYTPFLYIVEYKTQGGETPDPVEPTVTSVTSIAQALALTSGTEITVDCELTVGFVNGANILVCDAEGDFIQIYKSNSLKVGDKIPAGWKATFTIRYDVPQFTPAADLPAATAGTFTPKVVAAADVTKELVNHVIVVPNVVLAEASPATKDNFTGKVGDVTLNLRNNYVLPSVEAGTYDITLWVNLYNGELSLYVISFAEAGSAAIYDIEAAEAADAVYYNLNGVRVDNPENGIFIRVRGNKVDKIVK